MIVLIVIGLLLGGASAALAQPRDMRIALGSGFTMVPQQLAAFGEEAAPAVLDVVLSAQSYPCAIADGLWALRLMVERATPDALSAATRGRMREAAEYWVARPDSVATRRSAADLAAALSRVR